MSTAATARAKRPKEKQLSPAELIQKHQKVLARARKLYDRAELAKVVQPFLEECKACGRKHLKPGPLVKGAHIELTADGKAAIPLDNFAEGETLWGHGVIRHYGVKVIDV